jgi:formylglycine-generating enzyme
MQIKSRLRIFSFFAAVFFIADISAQDNGGFEKVVFEIPETAPGMILIEGGIFYFPEVAGAKKDSLNSFYISATEETNGQYLAYLNWVRNLYSAAAYKDALPDTTVWLKENLSDSLKNFLVSNYLKNQAFRDYPVVGVSPEQVIKYAEWKTDRMNEMILIREGLLNFVYDPKDSSLVFSTEKYLSGKWKGQLAQKLPSFDDQNPEREVRMEDGIFLPHFRMPTEREWKLAAMAVGDKQHRYIVTPKPYNHLKFDKRNYYGYFFVKQKSVSNNLSLMLSNAIDLHAVYATSANNYLIQGLNANAGEWVVDPAGGYLVAGGSWKVSGPGYSAVYTKEGANSGRYSFPVLFPSFHESKVTAATGFRLAMAYGQERLQRQPIDARIKRRKAK